MEWIQETIENPIHTETQADGRMRMWNKIEEEDKYLRVVLLPDGETLHNAFFDRNFKGENQLKSNTFTIQIPPWLNSRGAK